MQQILGFYTLERGAERTHQALCDQHFENRLDDLEDAGFRIVGHVRAPQGHVCAVCLGYDRQSA